MNFEDINQTNQIADGYVHHTTIYIKRFNMQKNSNIVCTYRCGKDRRKEGEGRKENRSSQEELQCISFTKIRSKPCTMLRTNKPGYRCMRV